MRRPLFRTALLALLASGLLSTPTVRAATAPTRPTIGTATASSGAATIRFTPASAQPRGVVVSSYTASCTTSGTTTMRTGTVSGATASADDLTNHCRTRLAAYKTPRHLRFVSAADLPLTTTGKLQRNRLPGLFTG